MNNTQLYLIIGIPTLTVILAWLSSRSDNNRLNDKVDRLADALRSEMVTLRRDINADMIAFRREVHEDLIMLHERIVKVEARQNA